MLSPDMNGLYILLSIQKLYTQGFMKPTGEVPWCGLDALNPDVPSRGY